MKLYQLINNFILVVLLYRLFSNESNQIMHNSEKLWSTANTRGSKDSVHKVRLKHIQPARLKGTVHNYHKLYK